MKQTRERLTYANVMATIAVFIALGGAAYAATQLPKNSVGPRQLKKNAVTTAKIKNQAVTGAKLNLKTLGTVPNADHAQTADRADTAQTAASSGSAQSAATAQTANALSPSEPWHEVGKPGEPQFLNGWKNATGAIIPTVGFYKDHEGIVHLRGTPRFGSGGSIAFNLPPGFRPAPTQILDLLVPCLTCAGNTGILNVVGSAAGSPEQAGAVIPPEEASVLDGVSFRAEG